MALPQLTEEQRAAALEKAAAARAIRAELKERLKRGGTTLKDVLTQAENDEVLGKMKVSALLEALPGRRQGPRRSRSWSDWRSPPAVACVASASGSARRCWPSSAASEHWHRDRGPSGGDRCGTPGPGSPWYRDPPASGSRAWWRELRQAGAATSTSASRSPPAQPRPGEVDGAHYHFVDRAEFDEMVADDELLEHAEYAGNRYGTPREPVEQGAGRGQARHAGDRAAGRPAGPRGDARGPAGDAGAAVVGGTGRPADRAGHRGPGQGRAQARPSPRDELAAADEFDVVIVNADVNARRRTSC